MNSLARLPGWIAAPLLPDLPSGLPAGGGGGDVRVLWNNAEAMGDWGLADGDVETGQDLETACLVSLFTDRLATPDFTPTDGTSERRGWWADPYLEGGSLGSTLWQLERAKKTRATLGQARQAALAALQWLIEDGIARNVFCNTMWLGSNMLGIAIAIVRPDGAITRFRWGWAWDDLAVLRSPVRFPDDALPAPELVAVA